MRKIFTALTLFVFVFSLVVVPAGNANAADTGFDYFITTISDSTPSSTTSSLEFYFDMTTTVGGAFGEGDTITIDLSDVDGADADEFDFTAVDPIGDFEMYVVADYTTSEGLLAQSYSTGTEYMITGSCSAGDKFAASESSGVYTFTACALSTAIDAGDAVKFVLGVNSNPNVVNPTTATTTPAITFTVDSGSDTNSATGKYVTVADNTLTAYVDDVLTLTVEAVTNGSSVKGLTTNGGSDSTSTAVTFGSEGSPLSTGTTYYNAQKVTVETNSQAGYILYLEADGNPTNTAGDEINYLPSTDFDSSAVWAAPVATPGDSTTYGNWGITTSENSVLTNYFDYGNATTQKYHTPHSSGSFGFQYRVPLMEYTQSTAGATEGEGFGYVIFGVEVSALQAAGTYTSTYSYSLAPRY